MPLRGKNRQKQSEQHGVTRLVLQQVENYHALDVHNLDSKARMSSKSKICSKIVFKTKENRKQNAFEKSSLPQTNSDRPRTENTMREQ